jgi:hypothetical protein
MTKDVSLYTRMFRFTPGCFARFYKSEFCALLQKCLEERLDNLPRKVPTGALTIGRVRLMDHPRKGDQLSLVDGGLADVVSLAAVATHVSRK